MNPQPPTGRLLVVSPHYDDAALSCAALLAREESVDILTVFGGSPEPPRQGDWARRTGFADSAIEMAARSKEEATAFAGTPHRLLALDLFAGEYVSGVRPWEDARVICEALAGWADADGGAVALPAGGGRWRSRLRAKLESWIGPRGGPLPHVDHEFVRDTGLSCLVGRADVELLLYEELPYLWGGGGERVVEEIADDLGLEASPFKLSVDRPAKAARIAAYASQLPHLIPNRPRLDDPAGLPETERYWRLRRG